MNTLLRWMVVLVVLSGGVAHAQNIAGNWQGTLQAGKIDTLGLTFEGTLSGDGNTVAGTFTQSKVARSSRSTPHSRT